MIKITIISVLTAGQIFLLTGCGGRENGSSLSGEERKKSIFWQIRKPKMQLDPIEEKDMPSVYYPVKDREQDK